MWSFLATVTTGFESVAAAEIGAKLPLACPATAGKCNQQASTTAAEGVIDASTAPSAGRVVFSLGGCPTHTQLQAMRQLHAVEYLSVLVAAASHLPEEKQARLATMRPSTLPGGVAAWQRAITTWKAWQAAFGVGEEADAVADKKLKFRVTPKKGGPQQFATVELGQAMAASIVEELGWEPALNDFDVEVHCHVHFDRVFISIGLNDAPLGEQGNLVRQGRDKSRTTLKASSCFSLLATAGAAAHCHPASSCFLLCDPLCGSGTICEAAVRECPTGFFISGDNALEAVTKAAHNRDTLEPALRGRLEIIQWDASRLPLRAGVLDLIVSDLPFGKQMGNAHLNARMYPRMLLESHRVLKPPVEGKGGGKAALLTGAHSLIVRELGRSQMWKTHLRHSINMGGMQATVFLLGKRYAKQQYDVLSASGHAKSTKDWHENKRHGQKEIAAALAEAADAVVEVAGDEECSGDASIVNNDKGVKRPKTEL